MPAPIIKIATRNSPLALWQANHVKTELKKAHPEINIELLPMTTEGDRLLATPLAEIGGKGLFIKELEKAMLEWRADIAVHSIKDMPVALTGDFCLAAVCKRESPYDVLVSPKYKSLAELPAGAKIGTSSLRRRCQLANLRPDLIIQNLRGNLSTRLRKLDEGQFDAIILAAAGLKRLGQAQRISCYLPTETLLPAVGQGAIGIECLRHQQEICEKIAVLNYLPSQQCIVAERAVSFYLGGSCQLPIAVYAELDDDNLRLRALVGKPDGSVIVRSEKCSHNKTPEQLGKEVAEDLLAQGADKILQKLNI